jgi:N-methylhydantoinase A
MAAGAQPRCGNRPVYFGGSFRDTPIYDRSSLPAGFRLDGPAVVEEFGSTTVVFPGHGLEVDERGILIVRRAGETAETSR